MLIPAVLIALVALIPLFFVVGYVLSIRWDQAVALTGRPRVGDLLRNTDLLVTGCVGLTFGDRHWDGLAGQAFDIAGTAGLERAARGATARARPLRQQPRLGLPHGQGRGCREPS